MKTFDFIFFILSFIAFVAALGLALLYVNNNNPSDVLFLLRPDTYDKVFPFLLGTVAVGSFAFAFNRVQKHQELIKQQNKTAKSSLDNRIHRLQEIYETVLFLYQTIRLQRRRLRSAFTHGSNQDTWRVRRGLFEEVSLRLNESQLTGERIVKTFNFDENALKGELSLKNDETERIKKLQDNLKSQIGGIQGILRNVLKTAEWKGLTGGTSNDEDLIDVPEGFIKFCDSEAHGNLSFQKIAEHFDSFAHNIIIRIKELESERDHYGTASIESCND